MLRALLLLITRRGKVCWRPPLAQPVGGDFLQTQSSSPCTVGKTQSNWLNTEPVQSAKQHTVPLRMLHSCLPNLKYSDRKWNQEELHWGNHPEQKKINPSLETGILRITIWTVSEKRAIRKVLIIGIIKTSNKRQQELFRSIKGL